MSNLERQGLSIDMDPVNAWFDRNSFNLSHNEFLANFEQLMTLLVRYARKMVSKIILNSILERVIDHSSEVFLPLSLLKIDDSGIDFTEFSKRAGAFTREEAIHGCRTLLLEFLSILGSLTSGIILPALYSIIDITFKSQSPISLPKKQISPGTKGKPLASEGEGALREGEVVLSGGEADVSKNQAIGVKRDTSLGRMGTGIRNLDGILKGGIPENSVIVLGGNPGSGKTICAQQIGFFNATPERPVVFFQTLSEPTVKTLTYLKQFRFFDQEKLEKSVHFIDLGDMINTRGLAQGVQLLLQNIRKIRPALLVIDSFKAFDDLASSREEYRKFCYEVAIKLVAWQCTSLLLGEFGQKDVENSPLFSVVDGYFHFSQELVSGEQQRFIRVVKLRGTDHNRDAHPLVITNHGMEIYAPRVTIQHNSASDWIDLKLSLHSTGIKSLDEVVGSGIPAGSSILIAGATGTGKTLLSLEFLYRGAKEFNEKGIGFFFEETIYRIRLTAQNMGWDFDSELKRGYLEIVSIPQPEIIVERDLLMIHERIKGLKAKRVVIDSVSVLLSRISSPQAAREKMYQLTTIIHENNSIGFFGADTPFGTNQLTHFEVEEAMVDGIIILTANDEGLRRNRYLEVYKLRNTAHWNGRYSMVIAKGGIKLNLAPKAKPGGRDVAA